MNQVLHQEERRQFERLLHQQRVDRVADRLKVLEAFLGSEEHLTAADCQVLLSGQGVELEPAFVGQTLDLLNRFGLATRRQFEGEPPRYEHRHLGEHHDHLICTSCGAISEFHDPELEALQQKVTKAQGFHPLRHALHIYGLCQNCLAQRQPSLPLALAAPGERMRVERLAGGQGLASQLQDLGIGLGSEMEVISAGGGSMVVAVRGCRVALGRGVAQKVMVSHLTNGNGPIPA